VKTYRSLGELPLGGSRRVIAIGTFDGVHLGHRAIIGRAQDLAADRGVPAMVVTFHPHPITVLRPDLRVARLTTVEARAELIASLGVDELLILPFTRAFARIRWERFVDMIASPPVGAEVAVVGENFRFGHQGAGTTATMRQYGRARGLEVETPPTVTSPDGKPVSSTRVRRLVAEGRIDEVAVLLARPHEVDGVVVHGEQRGRALGLPTANVETPPDTAVPGRGVYAGRAVVAGGEYVAAVNVGYAPTFHEGHERPGYRIEAFLLDYDGPEIYGESIRVRFLARLRDERRFPSPQELVAQVHEDVARTRRIAGSS
jgi:riboflavin kinase / FMN adenylyltransferase